MEGGFGQDFPPCCDAAVAIVQRSSESHRCPVCQVWHHPKPVLVANYRRYGAEPGDCEACPVARATYLETGALVECVCGREFPSPERAALLPEPPPDDELARADAREAPPATRWTDDPPSHPSSRPSVVPDARISVMHDPQPSSAPRFTRPSFSDDHVARLMRLLEELQVDVGDERAGGVSWAPPSDVAAQRYDRVVVQTSAAVPTTPNLAVLLGVVDDTRPTVGWTITERAGGDVTIESVLRWLREHGDRAKLREGGQTARAEVTRVYETVGYLYASEKARAKFDADPKVRAEAAPVRGRELVTRAMDAWWKV